MNLLRTKLLFEFARQQHEGILPQGSRLKEGAMDEIMEFWSGPLEVEGWDFSKFLATEERRG